MNRTPMASPLLLVGRDATEPDMAPTMSFAKSARLETKSWMLARSSGPTCKPTQEVRPGSVLMTWQGAIMSRGTCTIRFIPLFLLALACSNVKAQSTRVVVEKDSTYTRTIDVIRDNEKASIEFRSIKVQVVERAGKTRKFIAKMLYDSQTRLFFWECFALFGNYYSSESDAQIFADVSTVYLSGDRLRWFHRTIPEPLVVSESANRYDTIGQAQKYFQVGGNYVR